MSYHLGLRLTTRAEPAPFYERDLPLKSLAPVFKQIFTELVLSSKLKNHASVQAVLAVPGDKWETVSAVEAWERASPSELGWLRVLVSDEYALGTPVHSMHLIIMSLSLSGKFLQTLTTPLSPGHFDEWFKFASSFIAASGAVNGSLTREVTLRRGELVAEQERFPLLDQEMEEMGGEVEAYDVADLPHDTPPPAKKKYETLPGQPEPSLKLFIKDSVLEKIERAAEASQHLEIGGLLVGRAFQDEISSELCMTIEAHLPASASVSHRESLMFSHKDNLMFTEAMETKFKHYSTLGWYHTHPQAPFLSLSDVQFHQASWLAPWHVALVLGYGGQIKLFFHWDHGQLAPLSSFAVY